MQSPCCSSPACCPGGLGFFNVDLLVMPHAACSCVTIECSEWMCELRYLLVSFSCTHYMAWGAGFWGEGVEAGWSFAGNWYNLLFFPSPLQIDFVPLPYERDCHHQ